MTISLSVTHKAVTGKRNRQLNKATFRNIDNATNNYDSSLFHRYQTTSIQNTPLLYKLILSSTKIIAL